MNIDPGALHHNDSPDGQDIYAGLPWNHSARCDGIPGMVWYSTVHKTRGDQLQVGDWLDSLDHRGARAIFQIQDNATDATVRIVKFSDIAGDAETVRRDVEYDVVDPRSQVTPDGTPTV